MWYFLYLTILEESTVLEWYFFYSFRVKMKFIMFFDEISCLFFRVVLLISSSVIFFSQSYIRIDIRGRLFYFLVYIFILRIFFITFSLNFIRLILG
jgi:NADH-ubiquinone oxidoreductase chain 5